MADALWEGHTLLKTGLSTHRHTHRHTKVKTVYLPISLRSLGGYNNEKTKLLKRNIPVKSPCRQSWVCVWKDYWLL